LLLLTQKYKDLLIFRLKIHPIAQSFFLLSSFVAEWPPEIWPPWL